MACAIRRRQGLISVFKKCYDPRFDNQLSLVDKMPKKNIFYAQSGGATAVINASAAGVITAARAAADEVGTVYAGKNGIVGALTEQLIDTTSLSDAEVAQLKTTPGAAFGSCRYKLKSLEADAAAYERLIAVFKAHDIGYFFYNGGGDSQDTAHKVALMSEAMDYPITCIGIPKTIDNDLPLTDHSPGFGSVAKYVAISTREAALDVAGMAATSTKVFVLEVMGRHAGWIAASAGLAQREGQGAPHIILFPERVFDQEKFLARVREVVDQVGYCVIVCSEGIQNAAGEFVQSAGGKDAFGHAQLGGLAPTLTEMVKARWGYKTHWAVSDYLQRAAAHVASKTDVEEAYALGQAAVTHALAGHNKVMLTIERIADSSYATRIGTAGLSAVANVEMTMPDAYLQPDGFGITQACRDYLLPLIEGESYPPYQQGLPDYFCSPLSCVDRQLPDFPLK